ncbi:uncharacterized protein BX663DRAFT_13997 [Cokeromyces recurvatus]|uniref:uncharacterized protein n=1 Tax=Cokeromyces recurvatus TaxID=90255 RepID=UPI00221EB876|nr:uncharacterized protein BX663DRAFT_13997 [Cokeromyces recurvatus]KAI7907888.1 hypothetical protein BX663DRAFT_13997 [Cokeromyces recurvatus]
MCMYMNIYIYIYIFYKNSQDNILNKQENEAMDWKEDVDSYHLGNLTNIMWYREAQISELDAHDLALEQKKEKKKMKTAGVYKREVNLSQKL